MKKTHKRKLKTAFLLCSITFVSFFGLRVTNMVLASFTSEENKSMLNNNQENETPTYGSPKFEELVEKLKSKYGKKESFHQILDQIDQYPLSILNILYQNDEAYHFVLHYLEKEGNEYKEPFQETFPDIPLFMQWDERWGYQFYGEDSLALTGCGPTALSMVLSGLTNNKSLTPAELAKYAEKHGYYTMGSGTSWAFMNEVSETFGIKSDEISLNKNIFTNHLRNGNPIILSVVPGDFTSFGHFIVLTGIDQAGNVSVHDSNNIERSMKTWTLDQLFSQTNNAWVFYP